MAQEFADFEYHELVEGSYPGGIPQSGGTVPCGSGLGQGVQYTTQDLVIRVFRNSSDGHYHLFVVNKHASSSWDLPGWSGWRVASWKQLRAHNMDSMNPLGGSGPCGCSGSTGADTIYTATVTYTAGQPLTIPPVSVNHLELSQ